MPNNASCTNMGGLLILCCNECDFDLLILKWYLPNLYDVYFIFNYFHHSMQVSQGSIPSSLVNGRIVQKYQDEESDHQINEEEENEQIAVENWKLTYYQRTLSRSNELEEINEGFRNLRTKTFESEVIDNIRLPPLKFLKAEQVAKEFADGDSMEDTENGLDEDVDCQISAASIFGGDGSFGKAPVIEMSVEDTKQRLLNAER